LLIVGKPQNKNQLSRHQLLLENLGAPMTRHGGACGWPMETVSRELAKLRGETGRDR
jgi:hypothetical protein